MTTRTSTSIPKLPVVLPPSADGSSFAIYQAASAAHGTVELPEGTTVRDFFIDAVNYQLPHAVLTRVRACPLVITRGPAEIAGDDTPTIQFYLLLAGTAEIECEGPTIRHGPGDIVVLDSRRGHVSRPTAFDARIVMVTRDRAPLVFHTPGIHGMLLPGDRAGTRVLATLIETLVDAVDGMSVTEADHAVVGLCQVAAGLVEEQFARRDRGRQRFADPLLDGAVAYIEREFRRPDLTPDQVRRFVGTSRSELYRLFATLGGIDAMIRKCRLDDAMRTLLTDVGTAPDVPGLAAQHGFRNDVHFIRAFQARFGVTPTKFRAKLAKGDRTWLMAQAHRAGFMSLEAWLAALSREEA